MKKIITLSAALLLVLGLAYYSKTFFAPDSLVEAWTLEGFAQPESVVLNPADNTLFVSNVSGGAVERNGAGFIARVSLSGEMLDPQWITGLNSPKGMAIASGTLYVSDIDELLAITIADKSIKHFAAPGAGFLNDVAVDEKGRVYVSDMAKDVIYRLADGEFTPWLSSPQLENPNGLLVEGDELILAAWGVMTDGFATETPGHMKRISLSDKSITSFGEGTPIGNLDGVESDMRGNYFVTDWLAGKLLRVNPLGRASLLLDLNQGSADLDYIDSEKLIVIPMMNDGKIIAYRVN